VDDSRLKNFVNGNCSTAGKRTTCRISYPAIMYLRSYQSGYFVRASDLGVTRLKDGRCDDFYLALINIPFSGSGEYPTFPFSLRVEIEAKILAA